MTWLWRQAQVPTRTLSCPRATWRTTSTFRHSALCGGPHSEHMRTAQPFSSPVTTMRIAPAWVRLGFEEESSMIGPRHHSRHQPAGLSSAEMHRFPFGFSGWCSSPRPDNDPPTRFSVVITSLLQGHPPHQGTEWRTSGTSTNTYTTTGGQGGSSGGSCRGALAGV
jgi:hypothetical protein